MSQIIHTNSSARGLSYTPRKLGLVASLIRGRSVADALTILEHTPKRAAGPLKKTLESAKANAMNNHKLQEKGLEIYRLNVSEGTHLKRFRPGARGQAKPYEKRSSHIFITLAGEAKPAKKPAAPKTTTSKKEEK